MTRYRHWLFKSTPNRSSYFVKFDTAYVLGYSSTRYNKDLLMVLLP